MWKYVIRRLLTGLLTLFGITMITFAVIKLAPGDPAEQAASGIMNMEAATRQYERLVKIYGFDRPLHEQYLKWLGRLVTGDLGNSFHDGQKVRQKVQDAIWPTLSVALISLLLAFSISLPIGIYSAARQNGPFDKISSTGLYMLYSIPSYVMGIILILFVGVEWDLLPFRGMHSDNYDELSTFGKMWDSIKHYAMITFCFTFGSIAYYSRFIRQNLLEVIRQDYVRTARAKGLGELRVLLVHAFRNTLIPFITLVGLTFPFVLSGSVILEHLFNWPGLGWLYFESLINRDYPTIMALNFITAVMVLVCTLLTDLTYGLVDPRVSHK